MQNQVTAPTESWKAADRAIAHANEAPSGITNAAQFRTIDMHASGAMSNNSDVNAGFQPIADRENTMFGAGGWSSANAAGDIYGIGQTTSTPGDTPATALQSRDVPTAATAAQTDANTEVPSIPMWMVMAAMSPIAGADVQKMFQDLSQRQYDALAGQNSQNIQGDTAPPQQQDEATPQQQYDTPAQQADEFGA